MTIPLKNHLKLCKTPLKYGNSHNERVGSGGVRVWGNTVRAGINGVRSGKNQDRIKKVPFRVTIGVLLRIMSV